MRHRLSILLVVVVAMTFFCSCNGGDSWKELLYREHPTIESRLDLLVSEYGDVYVVSKMLGEDPSYLDSVRFGKSKASTELEGKVDQMYTYLSENGGVVAPWVKTRRHYGDKRWYDFLIFFGNFIALII